MNDEELSITSTGMDITRFTTSLGVGRTSRNLHRLVAPQNRPLGGLLISSHTFHSADDTRDDQFLASWQQLAYLHGHLVAFRDLLSPQLADEWDAWSAKSFDGWTRLVWPADV